jgi:hypothetical protein
MMLLIDMDRDKKTGWQGYDYIINRRRLAKDRATIEKNLNSAWQWEPIADVRFCVKRSRLELGVPKEIMQNHIGRINFEFKWVDNILQDGDIMDFYVSGDVAPSGRFNYQYAIQ